MNAPNSDDDRWEFDDDPTCSMEELKDPEKIHLAKAWHDRQQRFKVKPDSQMRELILNGKKADVWKWSEDYLATKVLKDWSYQMADCKKQLLMMKNETETDDPTCQKKVEIVRRAEEVCRGPHKKSIARSKRSLQLNADPEVAALAQLAADPRYVPPYHRKLLIPDISLGTHSFPIPVYCDIEDGAERPLEIPNFDYIKRNVDAQSGEYKTSPVSYRCKCLGGCQPNTCACLRLNFAMNQTNGPFLEDGKLFIRRPVTDIFSYSLFTCGDLCGCPPSCPNRIDNYLNRARLEIYRRNSTVGFGLRTLTSLSYGEVVVEFIGEVKNQNYNVAYSLELGSYGDGKNIEPLVDKIRTMFKDIRIDSDVWDGIEPHSQLYIDPFRKGNEARFISHGCYPNLQLIRVVTNFVSTECHRLMFFANRQITAGSELSFNYGADYVLQADMVCQCGTLLCKNHINWQLIGDDLRRMKIFDIIKAVHQRWKRVARGANVKLAKIYNEWMRRESNGTLPALHFDLPKENRGVAVKEAFSPKPGDSSVLSFEEERRKDISSGFRVVSRRSRKRGSVSLEDASAKCNTALQENSAKRCPLALVPLPIPPIPPLRSEQGLISVPDVASTGPDAYGQDNSSKKPSPLPGPPFPPFHVTKAEREQQF